MANSRTFALCAASLLAAVVVGCELGSRPQDGAAGPTTAPVVAVNPMPAAGAVVAGAVGTEVGERTIEDGGTGPYKAILVGDTSLATHTIFRPKDLGAFGDKQKLPILAWGNGACANSPSGHVNYLSEIASYGFLVVAIGPVQTGAARGGARGGGGSQSSQLLDGVNWAIAQNKNPASRYFNKIDVAKIGVFGHSCGGLQALEVSADPRVTTTIVVDSGILNSGGGGAPGGARGGAGGGLAGMPPLTKDYLAKLHGPVFYLLGGASDMAHDNGMDDFKRIEKLPVFVANRDVGHGGTFTQAHGGEWAVASVAWFQWQLKGDAEAGKLFAGTADLSKKVGWTVDRKNIN